MASETRIPLFPLADVVHFPRTELRLQVSEPRHLRLVQDLVARQDEEEALWIGIVLLKPGWIRGGEERPEVFPGGTAGRLLGASFLPDGKANIVLYGDFRFKLQREVGDEPYREALVRRIQEPWLNEQDSGILSVRRALIELLRSLSAELGDSFPVDSAEIDDLDGGSPPFEELVNRVAAELDIPALRKLQLLTESVPDRGLSVLSILRNRSHVLNLLRPYRHLATRHELN